MTFFEYRFPETIGQGAEGGPEFLVDVIPLRSGQEQRTLIQDRPRQRYTVSFQNREQTEFDTLVAFFRMVKGRAHGFRFKDKVDYSATLSTGVMTLISGSPSNYYQMYKRYTYSAESNDRKITKPVSGTVTLYQNGSPMGSGYSLDYTTGIALITAGAGTFTWSGEFDVPVRLDSDLMKPSLLNIGNGEKLWTWDGIELIELRQ